MHTIWKSFGFFSTRLRLAHVAFVTPFFTLTMSSNSGGARIVVSVFVPLWCAPLPRYEAQVIAREQQHPSNTDLILNAILRHNFTMAQNKTIRKKKYLVFRSLASSCRFHHTTFHFTHELRLIPEIKNRKNILRTSDALMYFRVPINLRL